MATPSPQPLMQAAERNTRPFLKAMGLALSVVVVIVVVTAATGADPTSAGELAGELSVAPLLAGLAVGVWAKLAKRRWHWPDYGLRFAICTIVFFGLNAFGRTVLPAASPPAPLRVVELTESEKQNLFVGSASARHADFGFTFSLPGGFALAPEIQDQVNQRLAAAPGMFAWALQHPRRDGTVLVYLAKGVGEDERTFRAFARGISKGARAQATEVLEDVVEWNGGTREFRYGARLADGTYAKTRCVPSRGDDSRQYVVCVQTLSPEPNGLDFVRQWLKAAWWNWNR